jgi:hypothetical protein
MYSWTEQAWMAQHPEVGTKKKQIRSAIVETSVSYRQGEQRTEDYLT